MKAGDKQDYSASVYGINLMVISANRNFNIKMPKLWAKKYGNDKITNCGKRNFKVIGKSWTLYKHTYVYMCGALNLCNIFWDLLQYLAAHKMQSNGKKNAVASFHRQSINSSHNNYYFAATRLPTTARAIWTTTNINI